MLNRILPVALLLVVPSLAQANEVNQPAQTPPTFVIRIASLNALFEDLKIVGGLVGQEDLGKKLDESIKHKLGPKGLHGIDATKPLGLYGRIGADISDMSGILMVPVSNAKHFKEMLEGLGWEVSPEKAGVHNVKQDLLPFDLQYRIANDYAYIALLGQDTLDPARLLSPHAVFGANPSTAALSLSLRLDQIPEVIRGMMLEAFAEGISKVEGKDGETKGQKELRVALTKEVSRVLENVLKDGEELTASFDFDAKTKQITADFTLTGKTGSKLAENIAKLGQRKTLFAGVLDKSAIVNGLISVDVPADVRTALSSIMQESIDKALATTSDAAKKKQVTDVFDALKLSLTAADLDAAFSLRGPSNTKLFTLVAGVKLSQGDKLAATLIELSKNLPEEDQNSINLNAESVANVAIHRVDLQSGLDETAKQVLGDNPLFVAFRDDALFLAIGEDAMPALKKALEAKPATMAPLQFDARLAPLAAVLEKNEATAQAAKKLLEAGNDGRVQMSLEGGPALHVRLTMALSALKLFSQQK